MSDEEQKDIVDQGLRNSDAAWINLQSQPDRNADLDLDCEAEIKRAYADGYKSGRLQGKKIEPEEFRVYGETRRAWHRGFNDGKAKRVERP